ncbi:hypothetical protein AVEN_16737-1 [Araneus ventricosus]|uniref:Uncharacterized protein n=1 Tax=Araneus ventricosus TaxID=182803 RepID=A0A4Y2GGA3_ARAVE|nr:hypothetical protein AVEN_16737-1 [Araneus ventricosus]
MARGFVGWLQHSEETSVNDRKVKGSGLDRELSTIPRGSCNCVCVFGRYSTTRCSAGRIKTAINPQRRLWNAETRTLVQGYFILFALEKLTIEKEFFFLLSHTSWGPKCQRAS